MIKNIDKWFNVNLSICRNSHLGCGSKHMDGWCNVDYFPIADTDTHRGDNMVVDVWCSIDKLSCSDESIHAICTRHVLEHFYKHETLDLIDEFERVLRPGAVMVHEMPNLAGIINLLRFLPVRPEYPKSMTADRDMIMSQFYGSSWEANDLGYPYHKYVWTKPEFANTLSAKGWNILLSTGSTRSHVPYRDFAVVAQKQGVPDAETRASNEVILKEYGNRLYRIAKQINSVIKLATLRI